MADVPTLLARIEALQSGDPLPGDLDPVPVFGNKQRIRENDAAVRFTNWVPFGVDPVPKRLAAELYDNVETIKAALRYWAERHQ